MYDGPDVTHKFHWNQSTGSGDDLNVIAIYSCGGILAIYDLDHLYQLCFLLSNSPRPKLALIDKVVFAKIKF